MDEPMDTTKNGRRDANRFVLGVDLDGVCADFYGALRHIAAEWLDVPVATLTEDVRYGLEEWGLDAMGGYEALHRFAVTQRQLFSRMEPIPGAAAALRRLSADDVRIRIITHRLFIKHFHREAVSQTIEWLDRHGIPYWDLCLMESKAAVGADLYIEDSPRNIEALRDKGLATIVFSNSTNGDLPGPRAEDWQEAERMVREAVREWDASRRVDVALSGR
jgi:5'(3')-deoxyribonucleotidase